ncbi:uncharacterized protein [Typha angustifolia]|uniref:uncharacterized protein n=1 Tax=Typha angustifolia TaxID=59011 RepID=UPI003C2DB16A
MNFKSKISGLLSKGFKSDTCEDLSWLDGSKTALKLAVARIKLLKNKREALIKQMRREVALLLETGQDQTARIRVEHVIKEENTMTAYDLIEVYCELIVARLAAIESQKRCPVDLKEAISSVLFASTRCADLPELTDVRTHFFAKYSKEFIVAALEARPECGVNHMIADKLSVRAPDIEMKNKTLTAIAQEHNVEWEPRAFNEQIQKQNDDLLRVPTTSPTVNMVTLGSYDVNPPAAPTNDIWTNKMSENVELHKPSSLSTSGNKTIEDPHTSAPLSSLSGSKTSEMRFIVEEAEYMSSNEKKSSFNSSNWNMEFKDATSAALAAAESAERASVAARAAAELASRGNIYEQHSTRSYKSLTDSCKYGHTNPQVEDNAKQPVHLVEDEKRSSGRVKKLEIHKPEAITKDSIPSHFNNNMPPTCDSVGVNSENGDETETSVHVGGMRSNSSLHSQNSSRKGSYLAGSGHSFDECDEVGETYGYSPPLVSEVPSMKESEVKGESRTRSLYSTSKSTEVLVDEYESGPGLKLGKLTGGIRNRGKQPLYTKTYVIDASLPSEQSVDDTTCVIEKSMVPNVGNVYKNIEVPDEVEFYQKKLHLKTYKSKPTISRTNADNFF